MKEPFADEWSESFYYHFLFLILCGKDKENKRIKEPFFVITIALDKKYTDILSVSAIGVFKSFQGNFCYIAMKQLLLRDVTILRWKYLTIEVYLFLGK